MEENISQYNSTEESSRSGLSWRRYRPLFVVAFVLIATLSCATQGQRTADELAIEEQPGEHSVASDETPLPQDPAVRTGTLDNGLKYYVRENSEPRNRAALRLAVNAGSILEDDDQLGLAHFVEHMAFAGTENFAEEDIVGFLENIGMRFGPHVNAYVNFDETVYTLEVPTENEETLERAFRIMEEWGHKMALDEADIERERRVIVEEWRLGLGASQRLREQQFPILFRDSRYADRLPIGDMDIVRTFEPATLRRFYEQWYRPDLMAVVAVGDFDGARVEEWITDHFSAMENPDGPRERPSYGVPGHEETLFAPAADREQPYTQVSIYNKAAIPPLRSEEDYRERIANRLYSRMINQRFSEIVEHPDAPLLSGSSGRSRFVRPAGVYFLQGIVEEDQIDAGLEALVAEAKRVQLHGFTPSEFERARRNELRAVERAYRQRNQRGSAQFASEYVRAFLENEAFPGIEYEYELYERLLPDIGIEEVNALADNYLAENNRVVLVSMVEREDTQIPGEEALRAAIDRVRTADLEPYEDRETDDALTLDLGEPGEIVEERYFEEIGTYEWRLSNGARVVVRPTDFRDDEILFSAFSHGGSSLLPDEDHVSASYAATIISETGIGDYSRSDLDRILSGQDLSLSPYIDMTSEGFSGSTSPEDLETFMQLLALHFGEPREDQEVFESIRRRTEGQLRNAEAQPNFQFSTTLQRLLWQDHPRSRPITAERIAELDYNRVLEIYRDRFADPGNFTYFFVGDIEIDKLRRLVSQYIAALPTLERDERFADLGMRYPEERIIETVRAGQAPQSLVAILFNGRHEYDQRENIALRSLAEVLRIRLREALRQDEGSIYSLSTQAQVQQFPWERYVVQIVFGADPDESEAIAERARGEIARIVEGELDETYVERAREAQSRTFEQGMRENTFWRSNLMSMYRNERDPVQIAEYPDVLESIDRDTIVDMARRRLAEEQFIQLILLPAE